MLNLFRPATTLMVQYAHYHRDRRNILTHVVGIPLIVMSLGMLLVHPVWSLGDFWFTPAGVIWFLSSLWYVTRGSLLLGLSTVLVNGALMWAAYRTPVWVAANGPKTMRMAGRVADGVIVGLGVDEAAVRDAVADLVKMDEASAAPEDYIDLGQEGQFVVAIGQGECAT